MSFKDFDKGITANELKDARRQQAIEQRDLALLRLQKESEHVLNILRTIKPKQEPLTAKELEQWRKSINRA